MSLLADPPIHPALVGLGLLDAGLDELAGSSLWSLTDADLAALVVGVERVGRRVAAARVAVLAQADAAGLGTAAGASSTAVWLRGVADVPIGEAKARLGLHAALRHRPLAAAAFAAGQISTAAAVAVTTAMDALPAGVAARLETDIEQLLVEVLGPLAAPHPRTGGNPDPRTAGQRYGDAFVQLCHLASTALPDVRGERPQLVVTIDYDTLVGHLRDNGLHPDQHKSGPAPAQPAPARPTLGRPASGSPPGRLDTGHPISGAAARRIGCDATIIAIVLAGTSEPLDIGRATPTATAALRRATIARDGGCIGPSCDRPPSWCDLHHIQHWAHGGPTALHNLALLCEHHHRDVHHHGWQIQMINGLPWLIPPRWIDPHQTPQLNNRLRTRHLGTTQPTDPPTPMAENGIGPDL